MTRRHSGFTLVEVLITLTVLAVVLGTLAGVLYSTSRSQRVTTNQVQSVQGARVALDLLARDLRNAGFRADLDYAASPQPPIAYIDSMQVILCADMNEPASTPLGSTAPSAYNPAGSPRPFPLNGTGWAPPIKYRTRAELIRWTLDVNNDGVVNGDDVASTEGVDAQRTPNPDDFVLVREVWGDSAYKAVAGDNTAYREAVSLVRRPAAGGIPPMFRVYLSGSTTPWDWSLGPLPPAQLSQVERVAIEIVSPSPKPNWRGEYAEAPLRTEVFATRNLPDFGVATHAIYGYVFHDLNSNGTQQTGEPGLGGVSVKCGAYTTVTASNGYYLFQVPQGTYSIRHWPPTGFMTTMSPDTHIVTVPPAVQRNFADVPKPGGTVIARVFQDLDADGVLDGGEPWKPGIRVEVTPGPDVKYTGADGVARLFAAVGAWTATVTVPDSFLMTTANPVSGSMANGDSTTVLYGMAAGVSGNVTGRVFRDVNRNGYQDGGETGFENVWVGVANASGSTIGYDYTDAAGDYDIEVIANDPPGTQHYSVGLIVPSGFYPTTTTSIGGLQLSAGEVLSGQNFGVAGFQVITLNASRVLSLASVDFIEKDWTGADTSWRTLGRRDADIVLGADQGGTDNVSVWFNQYNAASIFTANPTYTRNAQQSVLALALDSLDTGTPNARPDVITGTRNASSGNFFIWLAQNTSGNLGIMPSAHNRAYRTSDAGDVQAVVTLDCAGGTRGDVVVGTKSPTANRGTFEVWRNNEGTNPTFTREETYPNNGSIPSNLLGEVRALALADIDLDGRRDLIVGTSLGSYSGQLYLFRNVSNTAGNRFVYQTGFSLGSDAVTAIATGDFNLDGRVDVIVGTQSGTAAGRLLQYVHQGSGFSYNLAVTQSAPGIVQTLGVADMGGTSRPDVIVGWRQDNSSYVGGVRIYSMDSGTLPASGSDPSGGAIVNMVPAVTTANFNYGVQPTTPAPPFLRDVAAGVKITASTGELIVLIR